MKLVNKESQADSQALPELGVITPEFVSEILGTDARVLAGSLNHKWPSLRYRVMEGAERDDIICGILKRIEGDNLRVVGDNDNGVWQKGWGEIRDGIRAHGFNPAALRPQYFDHHRIMRLHGHYIDGGDARFVYEYDQLLRRLVLSKYLQNAPKVIELGCGTGTSQFMLADLLPKAELVASDWATPSQEIIKAMSEYLQRPIRPVAFNMLTLEGWKDLGVDSSTVVLTVHALEQLGDNCGPLLDALLKAKPSYCLHLEPILELYDESNLFDYLAARYHRRRNYLQGWLGRLRELQSQGRVAIMEERRLGFGDRYHEAYSVVQWKPL